PVSRLLDFILFPYTTLFRSVTRGPVSDAGVAVARTRHFRRLDGGWCPAAGRSEPRRASGWTAPRCGGPGGSAVPLQLQELPPAAPSGPASTDSGARRSCPLHPACPQPRRKPPHEPGRPEIRRILRR